MAVDSEEQRVVGEQSLADAAGNSWGSGPLVESEAMPSSAREQTARTSRYERRLSIKEKVVNKGKRFQY